MCRVVAYIGPEIPLQNIVASPSHSLLRQSIAANESLLAVNGDGFGVCWYANEQLPGLYKDVMPAWSDPNLTSVCRLVKSKLFLAHVRASTHGETSRANCHPFIIKNWSFMHNGQIPHLSRIQRDLEAELPDDLYHARLGTTDSELFFLLLLALGFSDNPVLAWELAYARISYAHRHNDDPIRMTCVLSDGDSVYAFRQSSDHRSPTLYASERLDNGGHAFASEPLDKRSENWHRLPENTHAMMHASNIEYMTLNHS